MVESNIMRLTDLLTPIYCLKHDNLQKKKYHNKQKVVSRSNAFACETTKQTANKLCTETNKSKAKTIQPHKNKNQTITIMYYF